MAMIDSDLEVYLKKEVLPKVAMPPFGELEATRLSQKMPVFLLKDNLSGVRVVSKAFQYGGISEETAWKRAKTEYENLKMARHKFHMNDGDFRIVEPLGKNKSLSALLVIGYGTGNTLDHYIKNAISKGETRTLYYKLRLLAFFLAKLHRNSETQNHPSPEMPRKYLKRVLHTLREDLIKAEEAQHIQDIASSWWSRSEAFSDVEVMVHGDATPTNFLFHHDKVTGIDLEKMKPADRCWDLGFLAAELKHNFLNQNKSTWESEPYIRHLLLEYAAGFQDLEIFKSTTKRLPLYMALGLLRIARNGWLIKQHRLKLVEEAKLCLKYQP